MKFIRSFLQNSRENPDRIMLDDCEGTRITFAQLDRISGQVYRYLKEHGIGREDFDFKKRTPSGAIIYQGLESINEPGEKERELIDYAFLDLIKSEGMDNIWLHIHCHAGSGRTGACLVMYDKMKNPEVPIEDICVRQSMLGSSYMLQTEASDEYKNPLYQEKIKNTALFEQYVAENAGEGYPVSWSEWLKSQEG